MAMRTSYKKNRPFDFKLIGLVQPNPVLYQRQNGLPNFETMKAKNDIWDNIAQQMGRDVQFCLMRWNYLRYQFQKELKRSESVCPKSGLARGSTWPYLERLQFLSAVVKTKPKTSVNNSAPVRARESEPEVIWPTYDCMQIDSNAIEQSSEETGIIEDGESVIIEEIVEEPNEQIIQEEIIYEVVDSAQQQQAQINFERLSAAAATEASHLLDTAVNNFSNIDKLIQHLRGIQRHRAERRIMAYLLKCQLRALNSQTIDDLVI